jgi:2-polyprenyl-3-methyl-5-hydroxy-6-metoxy-1,4-benzoquinol methylase
LGTLPHPDVPAASFDAITMWHSLEHVPSPQKVLRGASDALRTGGILAVSVPNFASWSFRQFQQHWFGLALPRHLTHFTPPTLCRMVEAAGFRVLSIDQVGRDGWIRKSARQAAQDGEETGRVRLLRWKWLAAPAARWTELTGQADSLRLIAEKV